MWYELPGKAWDYLMITGNIYLASISTLIIAALYWKQANVVGAVSALILGAITPIIFLSTKSIPVAIAGILSFAFAFLGMVIGSFVGGLKRGN
jgi:SSS family solute:Na+ symporter